MKENINNRSTLISDVSINDKGQLFERVDFGTQVVEYIVQGVTEHIVYGIFFSFSQKSNNKI